jgi:hypothetical protein
MQLQAVLGALADMAAAGYPSDMQQLAAAAQLSEAAARSIAAVINSHGQAGIGAVKQGLDAHVGFGQIKVVAALMALGEMWFAAADDRHQQQQQGVGPRKTVDEVGEWHVKQQQQQQDANGSIQPAALTDASNLPLPTPAAASDPTAAVCAGMAAAAAAEDQQMADAPAAAEAAELGTVSVDACSDDGDEQPAWRTVKRARPAFNISNKTGKRRRPTIAPPAAQQQAPPPLQQQQQLPIQLQQAGMVSPAPTAAGSAADKAAAAAALTTPAGAALITQQAVLQLLWDGTATGKQLLRKLGLSGSEQEQQLQQVLQELVEDGEQVLVTPEGAKVDINDECVRFIAF